MCILLPRSQIVCLESPSKRGGKIGLENRLEEKRSTVRIQRLEPV
jgi:hypothetical protein